MTAFLSTEPDPNAGRFRDTPLVAAAAQLDRLAVTGREHDWTWREVHTASLALAERFGGAKIVCNLCNSRVGFLIAWLAALRGGHVQILPPSGGNTELGAMLDSEEDPIVVVDDPQQLNTQRVGRARRLLNAPEVPGIRMSDVELAWSPSWDATLIRLYTSGTTGTPEPQAKTIAQLAQGARVLGMRLDQEIDGGVTSLRQMVCGVPPQHMFGLETSIMLALVHGIPVVEGRPLLPADVRSAFEQCGEGTAWIATPLHLRALAESADQLPYCRVVISSTMPLAQALAARAEDFANAPVLEIYGSTETGAVAMRRTAREANWRPLEGVRLDPARDGTRAWGSHFPSPQKLADQIEPHEQGGFRLLGRQSDLIKIAGRRASLAGLNLLLQDLPGLGDGVFYLPATGVPADRLVLVYAGAPLDRTATLAWLRERMDPAFLPRALIRVERLPRTSSGKLPRAALDQVFADWNASRVNR